MKKLATSIIVAVLMAVLLTLVLLAGCVGGVVKGSGNLDTQEMDFSDFTRIEASHGFEVEVIQSDSYSVSITADDNLFDDHIRVSKSGETLKIRLRSGYLYQSVTKRARITMPSLQGLSLSGGSWVDISDMSAGDIRFDLSGGSRVNGDIAASGNARFSLSGGSSAELAGSANDLVVSGSGGSRLDLEAFSVDNADIHLSGGSRATVNVDDTLNVDLSGGSKVLYIGEPTLGNISLSGDSTVSKK